jgi:rubredoxin
MNIWPVDVPELIVCTSCNQPRSLEDFADRTNPICIACEGVDISDVKRAANFMTFEQMQKEEARSSVRYAVKKGVISKPDRCSNCGCTDRALGGHHHNGYEPEHVLDVVWLCPQCHGLAHRTIKKPLKLRDIQR